MNFKRFTKNAVLAIATIPTTCAVTHAQRNSDAELAAGILNVIGAGINAAAANSRNNQNQQYPGPAIPAPTRSPSPFSGGSNNQQMLGRPHPGYNHLDQYNDGRYSGRPQGSNYYPNNSIYRPEGNVYYENGVRYEVVPSTNSSSYSGSSRVYSPPSSESASSSSASSSPSAPKKSSIKKSKPSFIRFDEDGDETFAYELVSNKTGKAYEYSIASGESQQIQEPERWKIRFKPTESSSNKTYQIDPDTIYLAIKNDDGEWGIYEDE